MVYAVPREMSTQRTGQPPRHHVSRDMWTEIMAYASAEDACRLLHPDTCPGADVAYGLVRGLAEVHLFLKEGVPIHAAIENTRRCFPRLNTLVLDGSDLSSTAVCEDLGLALLATGPLPLHAVYARRCEISDEGAQALGWHGAVAAHVDLSENFVGDLGLGVMARAAAHTLVLARNRVRGACTFDFGSLRALSLAKNPIHNAGIDNIAQSLRDNNALESLDLSELPAINIRRLADVLGRGIALRSLTLSNTRIGDRGVKRLAARGLASLRALRITATGVCSSGVRAVANALADPNCTLRTLSMLGYDATVEDVYRMANALRENRSVKRLFMQCNETPSEQRVINIARGLRGNNVLREFRVMCPDRRTVQLK